MNAMPRRLIFRCIFSVGIILIAANAAQAEPLGRLFMTPEYRAALERQRQLDIRDAQPFADTNVTVNGVVRRSSGHTTIWINQRPQHETMPDTGIAARVAPANPGQVTVAQGKTSATLRVGESINLDTREKTSALGDGRITVKPSQQAPR
jgi:hypothetical protein